LRYGQYCPRNYELIYTKGNHFRWFPFVHKTLTGRRGWVLKGIALGVLASFFFAFTFVLNRAMDLSGGSWVWSSVLRYLFMVPPLLIIVYFRGNLKELLRELWTSPWTWLGWSTIGFGLFYAPLCFAAASGPAWLVASTWQITIVAGSLLVPFLTTVKQTENGLQKIRSPIPVKGLLISMLILVGVALIQMQQAQGFSSKDILLGTLPVIVAAFAYPLGNRKMMAACGQRFDTYQRVLGMTISSIPFWLILALFGFLKDGAPSATQVTQTVIVAICSGVIATVLFFTATDLSKGDLHKLAAVEATQAGEVIFALLGELFFLHGEYPTAWSVVGIILVIVGMTMHSFVSQDTGEKKISLRNVIKVSKFF
ncbi:MAG TPA: multidrug resistance efflux transporter family protein, partial [Candidatus Deferrimicrobium sp.]|nr:multidrug resistance efflux transporter family protein [Candidatus Deferrimicrobium sp.]